MATLVGDHDDIHDPISPHPRRSEDNTPFVDDEDELQPQQEQHNETQNEHEQRLSRIETNTSISSRPREATELDEIRRLSTETATFSIQGVLVAQLFRLQSSKSSGAPGGPSSRLKFASVAVPLSVAYQTCAILVALLGAYRFWRQQNAIARGKVLSGGWEIHGIGFMTFVAGVTLLSLAIVIIVETN
ncbi:uncharacterized protein BHQ10_003378 [Talaromyces amestolkiae]|uniref:DUF202 domain-containing protein n=1 Tax=Talaromyces amestolkiae TaxID=1196081 RepID=A0A364KUY6_TALAM|nr:uncharacterized protein BHQ10_003378 [Talaromyces amestolkiae]RAO67366.1 hypothetical protein BHQ10_003378 [Talaromyces amestolkiae]